MLSIGIYMTETETFTLYPWHKSFGVIIFFILVARIIWRIRNGWPVPLHPVRAVEHMLARTVHWVLLIGTLLMPVSGFLMSSFGGTGVAVFGLEIVPRNPDPEDPAKALPHNAELASFFRSIHGIVAWTLVVAIVLHIAGALKHHLVDGKGTLRRMLGARV
jgi:cytochrome b561